jgi:hypothetical protein
MNVGIQDAHNLGWKLAAGPTGRADEALLNTYHEERRPVGANLLEHTRAQTALMTAYSPEGQALRALLSGRIATAPDMSRKLAERLPGRTSDVKCDLKTFGTETARGDNGRRTVLEGVTATCRSGDRCRTGGTVRRHESSELRCPREARAGGGARRGG